MKPQGKWQTSKVLGALSLAAAFASPASAEMSAEELAKLAQLSLIHI